MKETTNNEKIIEIDFGGIWKALLSRLWIICISSILCAILAFVGTVYFITPKYQSSAMFYVNNKSLSVGEVNISSADITAAKSLVDTYIVILNSRACLNDVIDYSAVNYDYATLKHMISAKSVNATEIFEVVVTSTDAGEAKKIANAIAHILPKRISSIVEGATASVVDYAVKSPKQSSPSYTKNTLLGFILGFFASIAFIVIHFVFDITIRSEEDVKRCTEHPVLTAVPNMHSETRNGGYYAYSTDNRKKGNNQNKAKFSVIGKNISFAASEAYKLLRTKIQFSFTDDVKCPIIGVSSAMAGEGKSVSSINVADSLAQLEKRVLLIDCDMRRPSLETKLRINKNPGLSNCLTGQDSLLNIIQTREITSGNSIDVIASGPNPPNPIELLSSAKMEKMLTSLREVYDYIILDLPPIGEVSDAMVAAKFADGILLVVRQDYCNTSVLSNAVSQFEFIEARILGIVMNCVGMTSGKYGKKYYKKYYSSYEAARTVSDEKNNNPDDYE